MALKNTWTAGETLTSSDANNVATEILGINASGVYASLPTVGHPGRTYDCTDNGNRYRDNGTSWELVSVGGTGIGGVEPPSGMTTTTMGSATVVADRGGRLLTVPGTSGDNWRGEFKTLSPTSNYTLTGHIQSSAFAQANYTASGILVRQSSNSNFVTFGPCYNIASYGGAFIGVLAWTSLTVSSVLGTPIVVSTLLEGMPKWFRIRDNGTNRFYEYSVTGMDWTIAYQQGRTTTVTPDQYGWGGDVNNTAVTNVYRLRSLSVV